jgi:hypothetical protein
MYEIHGAESGWEGQRLIANTLSPWAPYLAHRDLLWYVYLPLLASSDE